MARSQEGGDEMKPKKSLGQIAFESYNPQCEITWSEISQFGDSWLKQWERSANTVAREVRKRDREKAIHKKLVEAGYIPFTKTMYNRIKKLTKGVKINLNEKL